MPPDRRIPPPRRAQIDLPVLTTEEAILLVRVFERALNAIWHVHGEDMADRLGAMGVSVPEPPCDDYIPCIDSLGTDQGVF